MKTSNYGSRRHTRRRRRSKRQRHHLGCGPTEVFRQASDRQRFYIEQKMSYTCGPCSLAMAIADHVTGRPPTESEVDSLTKETGTSPKDGFPDWPIVMPATAQKHGLNAKAYVFAVGDKTAMDVLDQQFEHGLSAIVHVNNPRTRSGNGHFIYVAGRTVDLRYVIGNPDAPANKILGHDQPISRQALMDMMVMPPPSHPTYYKGTPGFTAVC